MREILFRGKRIDNGIWLEGDLRHWSSGGVGIGSNGLRRTFEVIPETVGQYMGLKDKNGKRIFEGDIVTFKTSVCTFKPCVVEYSNAEARFVARTGDRCYAMTDSFVYEVIGNIHDNPEMIGGKEE